jgi:hypothetical protein
MWIVSSVCKLLCLLTLQYFPFKAARFQIHAYFHENFENVFEFVSNLKGSNLLIINSTYKPRKLPKSGQICIKSLYCVRNAVEI